MVSVPRVHTLHSTMPADFNLHEKKLTTSSNCTTWYKNPANHAAAQAILDKAKSSLRKGLEEHDYVSYTNLGRDDPIDQRYKGADRLERLKCLKKTWDPTGVFTTELL